MKIIFKRKQFFLEKAKAKEKAKRKKRYEGIEEV